MVALKVVEQQKPKPEPEPEEAKPEAEFEPCLADIRLNLAAPYDIAKTFVRLAENAEGKRRYVFVGKIEDELVREPTLRHWKGDFKRWNGQCYEDVEEEQIRTQVYEFLDQGMNQWQSVKAKAKERERSHRRIEGRNQSCVGDAPCWIGREGPEARGLLVCRNGLLELETGRLWEHDPRLFCLNGVDFDFDRGAQAPRWEQFLGEVWPKDEEAVATLQEFFGLWLTDVTKYQKALRIVWPTS